MGDQPYRVPALLPAPPAEPVRPPPDPYLFAWKSLDRRMIWVPLGGLCIFPMAILAIGLISHAPTPLLRVLAGLTPYAPLAIALWRLYSFRCPRCARPFWWDGPFGRRTLSEACLHCGLARGSSAPLPVSASARAELPRACHRSA
jgi:hypothetical protein